MELVPMGIVTGRFFGVQIESEILLVRPQFRNLSAVQPSMDESRGNA